jgi:hypothetical protein
MKASLPLSVLLLCFLAVPQQSYRALSDRLERAVQLAEADNGQEAAAVQMALILEQAEGLKDRKERTRLLKRASKALKKCDKDHAAATRVKDSAAKRILTLAGKYHKKDWNDSARQLALLADELNSGSATRLLDKLPAPASRMTLDAAALMQAKPSHPGGKPWSLLSGDLRSSDLAANAESHLLFTRAHSQDWDIQCQVHPGKTGGQIGILFAHRSDKTFHRLRIDTDGKSLGMELETKDGDETRTLYSVRIAVTESQLDDGIPLTLGMTGQTLRIKFGKLQPRVFPLPLDSTVGNLGLWASNTGERPFRAIFTKPTLSR